jgi:hypothetical protein
MMVSVWWLVWVFLAGGYSGFLLLALLRTGDDREEGAHEALMAIAHLSWRHGRERRGFIAPTRNVATPACPPAARLAASTRLGCDDHRRCPGFRTTVK